MLRSHLRKTVLTASALLATTLLLTSCQDGDAEGAGVSDAPSASESAAKGGADGGGAQDGQGSGGKASGSWAGAVSYMAPGKYMVTRKGEAGQAFFTSEDTDIEGAGKICGDADGQAATPCSEDQLEAAAKKGFGATVKLENGVAVSIIEDHADSGGGSGSGTDDDSGKGEATGLFTGTLGYMAPGKYTLTKTFEGPDRMFFTATTTKINGAGWICGDPDGQSTKQCTEDELEAAAKKGDIIVVVDVKDGVAVAIDENHN